MILVTLLGVLILIALAIFQVLLVAGRSLGNYAWGGQYKVLPRRLRIASAISIVLYVIFITLLISKAGFINIIPRGSFLDGAMWVLTGYFTLGILMNAISRSKKERALMTPVAFHLQ